VNHFPQYFSLVEINLFESGDEIGTENIATGLDHVKNRVVNWDDCGMHTAHVELVALVEEVLQV